MMDGVSRLCLEDTLEHARLAIEILGDVDAAGLAQNPEKRLAVTRAVEIIGEAASAVSPQARQAMPALPWRDIVAMRNRLIHGYSSIDLTRLERTVRNDLPPLIAEIERLLSEGTPGDADESGR